MKVLVKKNDVEVNEIDLSHIFYVVFFLEKSALEEYENLKRLPDQRQLAAQRLQQQQLTSAAMVQLPHLQKMYLDLFRSMSSEDPQTFDYTKMLQAAFELGLGQHLMDIQKPSISFKFYLFFFFNLNFILISATSDSNQSPIPTTDMNDVVLLDSDDDTTGKSK